MPSGASGHDPSRGGGRQAPLTVRQSGRGDIFRGRSPRTRDRGHALHPGRVPGDDPRLGEGRRPYPVHRLPRVHDGLQVREPGAPFGDAHVCEVRGLGRVSPGAPLLSGDALQPVRRSAVRRVLSDGGDAPATRRHRGLRQGDLYRVQGMYRRLPLRRHLHQSGRPIRRKVQLLRSSNRHRPGACLRGRVPHPGASGRGHERPALGRERDHPS